MSCDGQSFGQILAAVLAALSALYLKGLGRKPQSAEDVLEKEREKRRAEADRRAEYNRIKAEADAVERKRREDIMSEEGRRLAEALAEARAEHERLKRGGK